MPRWLPQVLLFISRSPRALDEQTGRLRRSGCRQDSSDFTDPTQITRFFEDGWLNFGEGTRRLENFTRCHTFSKTSKAFWNLRRRTTKGTNTMEPSRRRIISYSNEGFFRRAELTTWPGCCPSDPFMSSGFLAFRVVVSDPVKGFHKSLS